MFKQEVTYMPQHHCVPTTLDGAVALLSNVQLEAEGLYYAVLNKNVNVCNVNVYVISRKYFLPETYFSLQNVPKIIKVCH